MKVLLINGSPRANGNTHLALTEVAKTLEENGIETQIISIGTKAVHGCIACGRCSELGSCAFNDELYNKVKQAAISSDGIIIGSPTYYAGPNGSLCALLDRLFYSAGNHLKYKPAASIAVCRRGGASATFDRLNKYFTINSQPIVSSQYWNSVHGRDIGEAIKDEEGMQTMRVLARNMAWMLKNLALGKVCIPKQEAKISTSFIR